jgi:hypothetical protein
MLTRSVLWLAGNCDALDIEGRYLQLLRRLTTPIDMMALNATVEPRVIKLNRAVMHSETMIEFRGMSHPGRTYDRKSEAGNPLSRAKANI